MLSDDLGIQAAADLCRVNPVVLYTAAANRTIPSTGFNGKVRFRRNDLLLWKAQRDLNQFRAAQQKAESDARAATKKEVR